MTDSIKLIRNEVKRIHQKAPAGHIHKGHSTVAANASIPTKFQTIVTENGDSRGFLGQARRFRDDVFMTEAPPPCTYGELRKVDKISPSFSKKGTGTFASKSKRQFRYMSPGGPGPGIYALPSMLSTRKDFNKCQVERLFQLPIAQKREKTNGVPAPNSYEVLRHNNGKANNVTANAAFVSKSKRELMDLSEAMQNPAPGHYEVNVSQLHDSVKVPVSSFKSTSKRQMQPDGPLVPGPGAYDPSAPVEYPPKLIFPRKHYLCISAPAMPLPSTPPAPGPGAYDVGKFEEDPKHYMSGSAFVSTTTRWQTQAVNSDFPGPSHYRPANVGKQSFIFNSNRRWI